MSSLPKLLRIGEVRDIFAVEPRELISSDAMKGVVSWNTMTQEHRQYVRSSQRRGTLKDHLKQRVSVWRHEISRHLKNKWFRRVRSRPNHNLEEVETRAVETVCL